MSIAHHIGFDIGRKSFRLVELRATDGFPVVLRTSVTETPHDFSTPLLHEAPFDQEVATSFVRSVSELLHRRPFFSTTVSITLPVDLPLIATVPVDATLTKEEIREHLHWECRTLSSLDPSVDLSVLPFLLHATDAVITYLVVSLPKPTVQFLKSVFQHLTFTVRAIDMAHFVMERAIRRLQTAPAEAAAHAVLGAFDDMCAIGVFRGPEYRGFRYSRVSYREQYLSRALQLLDDLLGTAHESSVESIHVYGPAANERLFEQLSSLLRIPVLPFRPMEKVSFLAETDAIEARTHAPFAVDTALCAAWGGLG